jgi:hypothetical protein
VHRDDRLLGALGISNFDWHDLKAEIGYSPGERGIQRLAG